MKLNRKRAQRGSVLFISLCLLLITAMVASGLLLASTNSGLLATRRRDSQVAFNAAEGGLRHALAKLADDPKYKGESDTALGDAKLLIDIEGTADPTIKEVVCTASVQTAHGATVRRTIAGRAKVTDLPPMWGYAMFSDKKLKLKKKVLIDSAPRAHEGNIYVNSEVKFDKKGVVIDGDLSFIAKVKHKPHHNEKPKPYNPKKDPLYGVTISGKVDAAAERQPLPQVSDTFLKEEAMKNGSFYGDIHLHKDEIEIHEKGIKGQDKDHGKTDWTEGDPPFVLKGFIKGNVHIDGKIPVEIQGIVFVTGKVDLNGSRYFGNGAIVAGKGIKIGKNADLTLLDSVKVALVSLSKKGIEVKNKAKVGGGLYAPIGKIKIGKDAVIFGSTAAKEFKVKDKVRITRNTDFQPPFLGKYVSILGWEER